MMEVGNSRKKHNSEKIGFIGRSDLPEDSKLNEEDLDASMCFISPQTQQMKSIKICKKLSFLFLIKNKLLHAIDTFEKCQIRKYLTQ